MALVVKALKIEIFVLCMIVLIGLAVRSRRSLFSSTQQLLFSMLGYTSAAYILFDMIWTLSDGVDGTLGIAANWISNAVSFSLFAIACLIWFIYSETVQGSRLLTSRYRVVLVALPTALVVVLAFTSYWTHALFYIDSQGVYRRGFAYMIQPIVSYCYVIHTSLRYTYVPACICAISQGREPADEGHLSNLGIFRHSGPGGRYLSGRILGARPLCRHND